MAIRRGVFSTKSRKALKTGWLITAGVLALYVGVVQPRERERGIAAEKASGLAASAAVLLRSRFTLSFPCDPPPRNPHAPRLSNPDNISAIYLQSFAPKFPQKKAGPLGGAGFCLDFLV